MNWTELVTFAKDLVSLATLAALIIALALGMNFVITPLYTGASIADVMAMSEDLIAHGYLTNQAYLGVSVMDLDASTANMYSLPMGSYVQSVVEGSCAERAGIQPKDIIIRVGGYAVEGNSTLQTALRKFKAGDTTTITVFRAGAEVELTITFDERPQDPDAAQQPQEPQQSGEMPSSGSYEDWYNFFYPFFGGGMP